MLQLYKSRIAKVSNENAIHVTLFNSCGANPPSTSHVKPVLAFTRGFHRGDCTGAHVNIDDSATWKVMVPGVPHGINGHTNMPVSQRLTHQELYLLCVSL